MMTGPASTGKTGLALELSRKLNLPLVANTARRAGKQMGIKPGDIKDFDTLLEFQETAMAIMLIEFARAGEGFVSDRTPADIVGYTVMGLRRLTEITGKNPTDRHLAWLEAIRDTCAEILDDHPPDLVVECPLETPFRHDGFRFGSGDPEERRLEQRFLRAARRNFLPNLLPLQIRGSREERMSQVLEAIREKKAA